MITGTLKNNILKNIALEKTTLVYMGHLDDAYLRSFNRFIEDLKLLEEERKEGLIKFSFEDFYKKHFSLMLKVGGTTITHKWIDFIDDKYNSIKSDCNIQKAIDELDKTLDKLGFDDNELWNALINVRCGLRSIRRIKDKINNIDELRSLIVNNISAKIPNDLMEKCSSDIVKFANRKSKTKAS